MTLLLQEHFPATSSMSKKRLKIGSLVQTVPDVIILGVGVAQQVLSRVQASKSSVACSNERVSSLLVG